MSKLYRIGAFAELIGVSPQWLREHTKELPPTMISENGNHRYYTEEQANIFLKQSVNQKRTLGYCRVSTKSQTDDLQTQIKNVSNYCINKGYLFEIIQDVGSGINYKKDGLKKLIEKVKSGTIDKVVILYKDRLVRFGFELIEYFCSLYGAEIEIIDSTERTEEQELTEDLIQIITVFANRLYGKRSGKTKRLIDEVKQGDRERENTADSE